MRTNEPLVCEMGFIQDGVVTRCWLTATHYGGFSGSGDWAGYICEAHAGTLAWSETLRKENG